MDGLRTRRRKEVYGRTKVTIDFTSTVTRCGINKDRNDAQSNSGKGGYRCCHVLDSFQEKGVTARLG